MSAPRPIARMCLLALAAAGPFPTPQPGWSLQPAAPPARGLSLRVAPPAREDAEEITVLGHRAPVQHDPHEAVPRFKDTAQDLQAMALWNIHYGSPPCCQSAYETDIGGQPGRP